jgi:hypothetical protein
LRVRKTHARDRFTAGKACRNLSDCYVDRHAIDAKQQLNARSAPHQESLPGFWHRTDLPHEGGEPPLIDQLTRSVEGQMTRIVERNCRASNIGRLADSMRLMVFCGGV